MSVKFNLNKVFKKKYIIVVVLVLLLLISGYVLYSEKSNSDRDIKLSDSMVKEKSYDSLKIVSIKAFKKNKMKHLTFKVKNITDKDYKAKPTNIVFFDENDNEVYKTTIVIPEIASGKVGEVDLILKNKAFVSENFRIAD